MTTTPSHTGSRAARWTQRMLGAGVVVLVLAELLDTARAALRRLGYVTGSWWVRIERGDRRRTRRRQIAALAGRLCRAPARPRQA